MSSMQEWAKIQSKFSKIIQKYSASEKSKINDIMFKKTEEIMNEQSLSLVYDKYGGQIYEKTVDVNNYIQCKKSGFGINITKDDSKLIETKTNNDEYNTDFINYDSYTNMNEKDMKENLLIMSDFTTKNDYLYKIQEQKIRKENAIQEGIDKVKMWFNTDGQKQFRKIDKTFSDLIS